MASRSLSIGLNFVDPAAYNGWDGQLNACEQDARDMQGIARAQGYEARTLIGAEATSTALLRELAAAAKSVKRGEHFLLTYSGHGGQVPDVNGDDDDHMDETWCLFDRMLLDDELHVAWSRFRRGVRILVLSDSCHSGSVVRAVFGQRPEQPRGERKPKWFPLGKSNAVYQQNKSMYDSIQLLAGPAEKAVVAPSVILLSGCQDHEVSYDGPRNGAFTEALLKTWNGGAFQGTHREFHQQICEAIGTAQHPNYFLAGAADQAFEAKRPFTIR